MISGFRDRFIYIGQRCRAYRNLNNGLFSLLAVDGEFKGKVIFHADSLELTDARVVISKAGLNRAIRTQTRNVHAYLEGFVSVLNKDNINIDSFKPATYQPFGKGCFHLLDENQTQFNQAKKAVLSKGKMFVQI